MSKLPEWMKDANTEDTPHGVDAAVQKKLNVMMRKIEAKEDEACEHFNRLTPKQAENLAILAEECGELIQAIGKILRHGYESYNPDRANHKGNRSDLCMEIGHVYAAVDLMGLDVSGVTIELARKEKLVKVRRYMHHD